MDIRRHIVGQRDDKARPDAHGAFFMTQAYDIFRAFVYNDAQQDDPLSAAAGSGATFIDSIAQNGHPPPIHR